MKVIKHNAYSGKDTDTTITREVESNLDGSDYERGEIETLRAGLSNAHTMIGQLIELLANKKGLFTVEELAEFLPWDCKVQE